MRRRFLLPIALCLPLAPLAWAESAASEPDDQPTDRTVRAHQLRFKRLQFPSLQPGSMTVTREGLVIGFVPKR